MPSFFERIARAFKPDAVTAAAQSRLPTESLVAEPRPLWLAFPDLPWGSLGWRMGAGEVYWDAWLEWFVALEPSARAAYRQQWPSPDAWDDFYDWIEDDVISGEDAPDTDDDASSTR